MLLFTDYDNMLDLFFRQITKTIIDCVKISISKICWYKSRMSIDCTLVAGLFRWNDSVTSNPSIRN